MDTARFATDPGEWILDAWFTDHEDSLLNGTVTLPLASYLTASGALEQAEAADRLIAWATAMKLRALARVEEAIGEEWHGRREEQPERLGGEETHALAVAEVATACSVSENTAARLLHDAADLARVGGSQWEVLEALEAGQVSPAHLRVILDASRTVPAECSEKFSRAALQRLLTRTGRRRTPSELRACLRKLRERMHPETLEARTKAAHRERGVWFSPDPDGMCTLTAHLPAEAGLAIYTGLDRAARTAVTQATEERTLNELRADAMVHHFLGSPEASDEATDEGPGDGQGEGSGAALFRPEVVVTIPIGLALGADHAPDAAGMLASAELEGYGPIDPGTARRLASLAPSWFRLFTDPVTGQALGVGRTAYRPPQALRRYLAHRDGGCVFPGCTHPVRGCEPDHTTEWQDGGSTDPGNLALLCRKHHALKSIGAWTYAHTHPGNGHLIWRSPLGRIHTTEANVELQPVHRLLALTDDPPPDRPPPDDPPPF